MYICTAFGSFVYILNLLEPIKIESYFMRFWPEVVLFFYRIKTSENSCVQKIILTFVNKHCLVKSLSFSVLGVNSKCFRCE